MKEHDGCVDCIHFGDGEMAFPCRVCKGTVTHSDPRYETAPDMWSDGSEQNDNVNHPSHYCQDGSMECIDEMINVFGIVPVMNFCLLNVWKYRKRAVYKNGEEDIKKSNWYMNKFMELKGKLK